MLGEAASIWWRGKQSWVPFRGEVSTEESQDIDPLGPASVIVTGDNYFITCVSSPTLKK